MKDERIIPTLKRIVELLVAREYQALDQLSKRSRVPAEQLMYWLDLDRQVLVNPPEEAFADVHYRLMDEPQCTDELVPGWGRHNVNITQMADSARPEWTIEVNLWTQEQGRSDYMLELTLFDVGSEELGVRYDDLRMW